MKNKIIKSIFSLAIFFIPMLCFAIVDNTGLLQPNFADKVAGWLIIIFTVSVFIICLGLIFNIKKLKIPKSIAKSFLYLGILGVIVHLIGIIWVAYNANLRRHIVLGNISADLGIIALLLIIVSLSIIIFLIRLWLITKNKIKYKQLNIEIQKLSDEFQILKDRMKKLEKGRKFSLKTILSITASILALIITPFIIFALDFFNDERIFVIIVSGVVFAAPLYIFIKLVSLIKKFQTVNAKFENNLSESFNQYDSWLNYFEKKIKTQLILYAILILLYLLLFTIAVLEFAFISLVPL